MKDQKTNRELGLIRSVCVVVKKRRNFSKD